MRGDDYAEAGAYFVTVCVQDRACLLGDVIEGETSLSDPGRMVLRWWKELPAAFPGSGTDAAIVMPNHIHGIVVLGTDPSMDRRDNGDAATKEGRHVGLPLQYDAADHWPRVHDDHMTPDADVGADLRVCPPSLPRLLQRFKTMTTNEYIRGVKQQGWPPFRGMSWQRNDYERIIRNDHELDRGRAYIAANPARWAEDTENPGCST